MRVQYGAADEMVSDAMLTPKDVEEMTNGMVKVNTLAWWRHQNAGVGPRWFRIGQRKVVYKRSDVIAWLDQQYAASAEGGAA